MMYPPHPLQNKGIHSYHSLLLESQLVYSQEYLSECTHSSGSAHSTIEVFTSSRPTTLHFNLSCCPTLLPSHSPQLPSLLTEFYLCHFPRQS
jgi:hypothetical protein